MTKNIVAATPGKSARRPVRSKLHKAAADDAHVAVPEQVDIPLPKTSRQQIAVPASINGRDLTDGRP
jgi:hypothetical protein